MHVQSRTNIKQERALVQSIPPAKIPSRPITPSLRPLLGTYPMTKRGNACVCVYLGKLFNARAGRLLLNNSALESECHNGKNSNASQSDMYVYEP